MTNTHGIAISPPDGVDTFDYIGRMYMIAPAVTAEQLEPLRHELPLADRDDAFTAVPHGHPHHLHTTLKIWFAETLTPGEIHDVDDKVVNFIDALPERAASKRYGGY